MAPTPYRNILVIIGILGLIMIGYEMYINWSNVSGVQMNLYQFISLNINFPQNNSNVNHIKTPTEIFEFDISLTQNIINEYVNNLSSQNYNIFNKDIFIQNIKFEHLSFEFMFNSITNKSILFHGDSFCRKFWRYLVYVMHYYYINDNILNEANKDFKGIAASLINEYKNANESLTMGVQPANMLLKFEMDKIGIANSEMYNVPNEKRKIYWKTFNNYSSSFLLIADVLHKTPYIYKEQFEYIETRNFNVNILFINFMALHMTHLYPERKFEHFAKDTIIHLERQFDQIIDIAINNSDIKCVIFRPPNPICREIYNKKWVGLSKFYEEDIVDMTENELKQNDRIKKCLNDQKINADEIYYQNNITDITVKGIDICSKYSITQTGVNEMNNRMKKYVYNRQNDIYSKHNKLKLIYYDQGKLFSNWCDKTYDGRHYIELLPVESVVVFNIIDKWC